jgi:glycosyltransferase involved in cell wall biosynthesis
MQPFVADCLNSIFAQQGNHDYEVIVIDDASTDASLDVVAMFSDPRIRLIRHRENMGSAFTITEGLYAARGGYVARIDPDDRYRSYFLNRTVDILDRYPDVGLVYGRIAMINSAGMITDPGTSKSDSRGPGKEDRFLSLLKRNDLPAPTVLARREAWALGLPIPGNLKFNDWYLSLSIAERWPLFFIDEVLADYRIHDNNMHYTMIRDRWGESIILEVLERFLSAPGREKDNREQRNQIYAAQYNMLADQYFGCGLLTDARRCYWQAIFHCPGLYVRSGVARRLFGSYVGLDRYERLKRFAKQAFNL